MPIKLQGSSAKLMCNNQGIAKMYCENNILYSSGNTITYTVTYHVDTGVTYQEEVDEGASCLSPQTFIPEKSGWEFAGWRQDTEANGSVLSSLAMYDVPVTLYAVFRQTITLSYNGNSATNGSTAAQTGCRYYNNGNVANPGFTLRSNGFSRSDYTFSKWALGSASGTQYAAGASVTLSASTTMYAVWIANSFEMVLNTTGWTQKTTSGYVKGIEMRANEYASQGVSLLLTATDNKFTTIAGYYKTINTRGLPKVDIYLNNYHEGRVIIGNSDTGYLGDQTKLPCGDQVVTLNLAASQSQELYICAQANVGDPWQQIRNFHVKKLVFHS